MSIYYLNKRIHNGPSFYIEPPPGLAFGAASWAPTNGVADELEGWDVPPLLIVRPWLLTHCALRCLWALWFCCKDIL